MKKIIRSNWEDGSLDSDLNWFKEKFGFDFWDGQTACYILCIDEKCVTYISDTPITLADCEEYDKEDIK